MLGAHCTASCAEEPTQRGHHPLVRLGATRVSCARGCVVTVKVLDVFFAATLSKRAIIEAGEGGEHGNL